MARLLLVVGLVLAIVLPTAFASERSARSATTGEPQVFSVAQVLRAFRSQGLTLARQPVDVKFRYQRYATTNQDVSVDVYPATQGTYNELYAYAIADGDRQPPPPTFASRRNLSIVWTRHGAAVHRALDSLRHSAAVPVFWNAPTYTIFPGHSVRVDADSPAQVDCVQGSSDASETPADIASVRSGASSDGVVTLGWTRPAPQRIAFSCT